MQSIILNIGAAVAATISAVALGVVQANPAASIDAAHQPVDRAPIHLDPSRYDDVPVSRSFDRSGAGYGIRIALADVKGITDAEIDRVVAGQPYASLADFWQRSRVSRPVVERLVLAGGFDDLYALEQSGELDPLLGPAFEPVGGSA